MTYVPGTILTRTEPFTDESGPDDQDLTVYNEVKVVGPSPVVEMGKASEWEGAAGSGVLIQPIDFGPTLDRPQGELERDYDVKSIPEAQPVTAQQTAVREQPGPSPEETFARDAAAASA